MDSSVCVTGIGTIVPGASEVASFWQHLRDGASQFGFLTRCDPGEVPVRVAGQVEDFDHREHLPELAEEHADKYTRDILVVLAALAQARADAGLTPGCVDPERVELVASCSRGPVSWIDSSHAEDFTGFDTKSAMLCGLPGTAATLAAIHADIRGPVVTVSNACVGGNQAIGLAARAVREGRADVAYVVGHEFPLTPVVLRSFGSMGRGVLAAESVDPARAMKPYTRHRDGVVLAEGAVVLCLERTEQARARGARAYAEIRACQTRNEAANPFSMDLTGKRTAAVVNSALAEAGATARDVDYYCGHGTGTRYNDLAESRMMSALYEGLPRSGWPPLTSVKPIYGHLLGAAGVVNAAATALMIHHGVLAPTINYTDPDPECDHDHVGEGAREARVDLAVSLNFAIGSQTSALVLGSV